MAPSTTVAVLARAASSSAAAELKGPANLKVIGVILAVVSGLLIGSSFVFKKKGLLASQKGHTAGEGVAYLKSPLWWLGMIMMIVGELCNFAAYAFTEAIVVTPLGALSVVICAILSSLFLNEKLSLFGWLGCALCILGSTIIALNAPAEQSIGQITEFQHLFLAPGFLVYIGILFAIALSVIFWFGPKYGDKNMLWFISVCSLIGGISVSVTTGLGSAIVTTAMGDNQFKHWFIYFLLVFVVGTLLTEVFYLNKALALFNTAMVTPTYYVAFTFCSLVTTVVLFQGLKASVSQILTIVMAFFSICIGITILQMSKIDPTQLKKLDRRSTMLLQAARSQTQGADEKDISAVEDPGIDALRGSFGAVGSVIRARSARRISMNSRTESLRARHGPSLTADDAQAHYGAHNHYPGMRRHQLYDAPMPPLPDMFRSPGSDAASVHTLRSNPGTPAAARNPTIKFGSQDLVHTYAPTGAGSNAQTAVHEFQTVRGHNRETNPEATDSTSATLGVGARYSNFLSLTSPSVDTELGTPRSFIPGSIADESSGRDSVGYFVQSPSEEPLTAPAGSDSFHHPRTEGPYANSPATATAAVNTFEQRHGAGSIDSSRSSELLRKE